MSREIDKRIVEMAFDNGQFERGVETSLKTIDNLKKGLDFDKSVKSIGGIGEAFKTLTLGKIADDVENISSKFGVFGVAAFSIISNLTSAVVNWGKEVFNTVSGIKGAKLGLMEYETQINAIQTILANTASKGVTMDQVTNALDELNSYADLTIYNFTEMTRNIAKFTAAGVDLDTSVEAIKGIANLAAFSGSNSEQASRGMYQLSQAIATGTVRVLDWNSVNAANMGGEVFQESLKETARVHGIAIDDIIKEEGSFRASLSEGWLSSAVLLDTLAKFTGDLSKEQLLAKGYTEAQAEEIIKLGQTANDSATKIKTFSQLIGTLKEVAGSGWTKSWEHLLGNFEEAKELFTNVNDVLGGFVQASADARNSTLYFWKQLGGRDVLIETVATAFGYLLEVIKPIGDAFRTMFPPMTGVKLFNLTEGLKTFVDTLKPTQAGLDRLKRVFTGVFAAVDIVIIFIKSLWKELGNLLGPLSAAGPWIAEFAARIGDWLLNLRNTVKATNWFGIQLRKVSDFIRSAVAWLILASFAVREFGVQVKEYMGPVGPWFAKLGAALKPISDGLVTFFKSLGQGLGAAWDTFKLVDTSGIVALVDKIKGAFSGLKKSTKETGDEVSGFAMVFDFLKPHLEKGAEWIGNIFKSLGDTILNAVQNLSFKDILDGINTGLLSILTLGASGAFKGVQTFLSTGFLTAISLAITNFIKEGSGTLKGVTGVLDGVSSSLKEWQKSLQAKTLMEIAKAIGLIALSLLVLSFIDPTRLAYATGAITILFADLLMSMNLFAKVSGTGLGLAGIVLSMYAIAGAILTLSIALLIMSRLDWEDMAKGLAGLTGITAILVTTSILLSKNTGKFIGAAIGMTAFALGLLAISGVVILLGNMDVTVLNNGLLTLAAIVTQFVLFSQLVGGPSKAIGAAFAMVILAGGIFILAGAIQKIGEMDQSVLTQGLVGMAAGLTILFAALKVLPKDAAIKATILVGLSYAMTLLQQAMEGMGKMSWDEIGRGLTVLAGSLYLLVLGLYMMQGTLTGAAALLVASFALTVLAGALKSLGSMSFEEIGMALLGIAGVFVIFGLAGLILGPMIPVLLGLAAAMLVLGIGVLAFGIGISFLATGIALLAASGTLGIAVFALFVMTMLDLLPLIIEKLGIAFGAFIDAIIENSPKIFEALTVLLLGVIQTAVDVIPELIAAVVILVTALVEAIAELIPLIIAVAFDLVMALLTEIRDNIGEMTTVAIEIVTEFIDAVADQIDDVVDSAFEFIIAFVDGLTEGIEKNLPTLIESVAELGIAIIDGLIEGLGEESVGRLLAKITEVGSRMIEGLKKILGIKSPSTEFTAIGHNAGNSVINGVEQTLQSESPSKALEKLGVMGLMGFANGLRDGIPMAIEAAKEIGKQTVSTLSTVVSKISDVLTDTMDMSPTIRPVIDLSDILASGKTIDEFFARDKTLSLSSAVRRASAIATDQTKSPNINPEVASTVSFVQHNYSPKALSRLEIYRQTRNQLNALKGVVTP